MRKMVQSCALDMDLRILLGRRVQRAYYFFGDSLASIHFQGIVADVAKCHNISNWDQGSYPRNEFFLLLSDRDSLPM